MEKIIGFTVDGVEAGTSEMFIVDGTVDTSAVEEVFYKILRRESANPIEEETSYLIDNLTQEQEDKLKEAHARDYHGTDDDMPDAFDAWLMELSLPDLKKHLTERHLSAREMKVKREMNEREDTFWQKEAVRVDSNTGHDDQ